MNESPLSIAPMFVMASADDPNSAAAHFKLLAIGLGALSRRPEIVRARPEEAPGSGISMDAVIEDFCGEQVCTGVITRPPNLETLSIVVKLRLDRGLVEVSSSSEPDKHVFSGHILDLIDRTNGYPALPKYAPLHVLPELWQNMIDLLMIYHSQIPQRIEILGRPRGMGASELIPAKCWREKDLAIDWRRQRISIGNKFWTDVRVRVLGAKPFNATTEKRRRRERCNAWLLEKMRSEPLAPIARSDVLALAPKAIPLVTTSEFDWAWRQACATVQRENNETRWGRPGAPRRGTRSLK